MKLVLQLVLTVTLWCLPELHPRSVSAGETAPVPVAVSVQPEEVHLCGPRSTRGLLITGRTADGHQFDLTRQARYSTNQAEVATIDATGQISAHRDGRVDIEINVAGKRLIVPVTVVDTHLPRRLNFENDIVPLLSKFGCNSSGCHGKAEGQNGFKLSVFGFDARADYEALVQEGRGRRVFPAAPERSLLLSKGSGSLPHGGGSRIAVGSPEYATLEEWIASGLPWGEAGDPKVASIEILPRERTLRFGLSQQLHVQASLTDSTTVDVTALARFQSNHDALAAVDESGLVTAGQTPGQVAIMASYMGAVDVFEAIVPRPEPIGFEVVAPKHNFIDRLVYDKLQKLNIAPSPQADDATFLRRVYLDCIGTLPTAVEARRFLADSRPDRRARLVDALLERPEFADFWALWWSDLLRVDRQALGHKAAYAYYDWVRDSLATNKPLDAFAREVVTAEGPLEETPPAQFYQVVKKPGEAASTLSQVFLGVRIACAECHHHPFDRWSQTDYFGMQAYFAPLGRKKSPLGELLVSSGSASATHPRTSEKILPHPLGRPLPAETQQGDPRLALAEWMTAADNPWFARNLANRFWAHFLGRGLVEPVDDLRATNPPTNSALLDALAEYLVEHGYDMRSLVRTITASAAYQRSSETNSTNVGDEQNYSRALFKRLSAEVLFDAVCQTTGVPEKFDGLPAGYRAIQLWDSQTPHYFLKLFGRPQRHSACECERSSEASIAQVLHLMNAPGVNAKLTHAGGNIERWLHQHVDNRQLIDEVYLTFYNRFPDDGERLAAMEHLQSSPGGRRQATEDLAWSLLNSLEFVFSR